MKVKVEKPLYFCPTHGLALSQSEDFGWCVRCKNSYPIHEGIWMLDVMNRRDRVAFDAQVLANPVPFDLNKAQRLLEAGGIGTMSGARILDVGCGLGDLSHGLSHSPTISNSEIYAFDHSVESLRQAVGVNLPVNGNHIHFSAQDALQLFFADRTFDLVAGSAVLHHFLDYPAFFKEAARVLKPGATAIFSEPFFDGYFWPTLFLKSAIEECDADPNSPELKGAITLDLLQLMCRNRGNSPALEELTDKHFFRECEILAAADDAGFDSVRFQPFEPAAFYDNWMGLFLDIYGVSNLEVRRSAIAQYNRVASLSGPMLPSLMAHFKYIILHKSKN